MASVMNMTAALIWTERANMYGLHNDHNLYTGTISHSFCIIRHLKGKIILINECVKLYYAKGFLPASSTVYPAELKNLI